MLAPEIPSQGERMRWKIEKHLVFWGFALAAVIVVSVGWESYRSATRFAEASGWQKHTYEVLRTLDDVAARLVDAESGQRGYLLTGDQAYLEPYRAAIKSIDQTIANLKNLTSDNPNQQKRILTLEPLLEKELAELQRTIDLRKSERLAATNREVLEGSGKQWMDQIRALLAEMANQEDVLLKLRTEETNESATRTSHIIFAGALLSILLLALCFRLLYRELSERKRAQTALEKSEKWFSTTLGSIGDAVIAADTNGAVTFMNSIAQSLTGWNIEEARGKSMDLVFDIVNKETRRPVETPVKKVFREGKVVGLADHTLLISKNGREFDIEDSAAPIVTNQGAKRQTGISPSRSTCSVLPAPTDTSSVLILLGRKHSATPQQNSWRNPSWTLYILMTAPQPFRKLRSWGKGRTPFPSKIVIGVRMVHIDLLCGVRPRSRSSN
jgi:PAS domain S-box-containing protein